MQERKGAPSRPEKCSALGGWPLDTTNRYRPFDMDLGIVQPNAKVLPAPGFSIPSSSCNIEVGHREVVSAALFRLSLTKSRFLDILISLSDGTN